MNIFFSKDINRDKLLMEQARRYFGTDGIRGYVGQFPINAEFVLKLGWATGKVLAQYGNNKVVIGKDTRSSGHMLESALEAGLSSAGTEILLVDAIPTPAIAYLTRTLRADAGIVISASHNPYFDNGIKFFSQAGYKLPDELEHAIEYMLDQPFTTVDSAILGASVPVHDAAGRYIEFCKSAIPHQANFKNLRIVLDCSNGATYHVAPSMLRELNATVIEYNTCPNGLNINHECGSTHPHILQQYVLQEKADVGIAFDGDGDRLIMVDHTGAIVDGDELLYIMTKNRLDRTGFFGGVVGTLASNMGLEIALQELGVPFQRARIGDRYVMQALQQHNWILGGEPSGHIVCLDATTTGDGMISALRVLQAITEEGKSLYQLKSGIKKFPQVTLNVRHNQDPSQLSHISFTQAQCVAEEKLLGRGRVLIRKSGTEPVIRVMVEGEEEALVQQLAQEVVSMVEADISGS